MGSPEVLEAYWSIAIHTGNMHMNVCLSGASFFLHSVKYSDVRGIRPGGRITLNYYLVYFACSDTFHEDQKDH